MNLQQIPARGELAGIIRGAFPASEGYKMVCADYSGFEVAIIAEFSDDGVWLDALNHNKDLHGELCSRTFNIPLSDVRKPFPLKPDMSYRDIQKILTFGVAYGMSEYKLAATLYIDVKKAKKILKNFLNGIPQVKKFLNTVGELAVRRGYIATPQPLRRIRWFEPHNDNFKEIEAIRRKGKNTPIQSTNANLIKLAMVNLQEEIDKNNWDVHLLLSIHDEVLAEARIGQEDEWAKVQQKIMEESAYTVLKKVKISAEPKISDVWMK